MLMGNPILRRKNGQGDDGSHHGKISDDDVNGRPTAAPSLPTEVPTTILDILSKIENKMTRPTDIPAQFTQSHPFPSGFQWSLPIGSDTQSISTSTPVAGYPENVPSTTPSPTLLQSVPGPLATTVSNSDDHNGSYPTTWGEQKSRSNKMMPAVAGAASVVALAVISLLVFFFLRKRQRQRQQLAAQAQMREMKAARAQPQIQTRMATSPAYAQYLAPPSQPSRAAVTTPPPVILGPIVPGSNGAYYTGIDTSDVVSMNERTGLGNPFADGDSLNEEPPPPYRPKSVPPISRDTSLRQPPALATTSQTNLIGGHNQTQQNPFADPHDDDTISEISGPTLRGHDRMSIVSDLSYQEDPVVVRPTV